MISLADVYVGEGAAKVATALEQFALARVRTQAEFDLGHGMLFEVFGPSGEIERKETLDRWFSGSLSAPDAAIPAAYHMILARDIHGEIAGVRDCFVTVDRASRRAVVLLSHSLVLPAFRRSGLAALLRTAPITLAREMLGADGEIMLVAEMEMVEPDQRISVIRLISYGRAGFGVIPPSALPYAQPDFHDFELDAKEPVPLPFLALVRVVGAEASREISRSHAEAVVAHLQAIHACHCRPDDLVPIRDHALRALAAWPGDSIPLIAPPRDTTQLAALSPLLRARVQHLYPTEWRWGNPDAKPEDDLATLLDLWSSHATP